ncbi:MAG: hypothetical protein ACR2L2_17000 [Acidobacteriota bacterium]
MRTASTTRRLQFPSGLGEDAVLELWAQRYDGPYEQYGRFLRIIGTGLALGLGAWAAALGLWRRSLWQGLGALAAGGAVTVAALSILPWVYFPFDQYPASALWVMGRAPVIAVTWIAATVVGQILIRRNAH